MEIFGRRLASGAWHYHKFYSSPVPPGLNICIEGRVRNDSAFPLINKGRLPIIWGFIIPIESKK
jgi:hypothetical protein